MSTEEKRKEFLDQLSEIEHDILTSTGGLDLETADQMRENVIGITRIPIGLAENFVMRARRRWTPR